MIALVCGAACARVTEPPRLPPERLAELETALADHGEPPVDYVVGLFRDHDVVFLGEHHRVRHDLQLVQSLLAPLQAAGVRALATEFARREDQAEIDTLLESETWNEELGRRTLFRQLPEWGYREYLDVFREAWRVNAESRDDATPFRVLGLNDSPDWSLIRRAEDRDDGSIMKQVWRGGGEHLWAETILRAVGEGEKVLVHSGIHHAFTRYRQPVVREGDLVRIDPNLRAGNHVYEAIGERAVTIYLHAPFPGPHGYGAPPVHAADGILDGLMLQRSGGPRPVGFRVRGTAFGALPIGESVYRHGYESGGLEAFCDGWVYTRPLSKYRGVTPVPDWVTAANLEQARRLSPNFAARQWTVDRFNESIERSARMPERWARRLR